MHTPTAFILRCATSPCSRATSLVHPLVPPSRHLSRPLTTRSHTLSKRIFLSRAISTLFAILFFVYFPFLSSLFEMHLLIAATANVTVTSYSDFMIKPCKLNFFCDTFICITFLYFSLIIDMSIKSKIYNIN